MANINFFDVTDVKRECMNLGEKGFCHILTITEKDGQTSSIKLFSDNQYIF